MTNGFTTAKNITPEKKAHNVVTHFLETIF
jgi:hypothetical protein